ncbi:hypothetical protein C8R45DRAFT_937527 [Mycena sanguinolenta]|nr:hypothetical protein C8R45DRAFT_937527 [Mycena sanguinolenta]
MSSENGLLRLALTTKSSNTEYAQSLGTEWEGNGKSHAALRKCQKRLAALLGYMSIVSNFFTTEVPSIDMRIYLGTSAATNIVSTCLTAGRIWYISRAARIVNQNAPLNVNRQINFDVTDWNRGRYWDLTRGAVIRTPFVGVSDGLVDQMVNILPTLIFESAPAEVQVPAVRIPRRHERGLLEDVASEVIEIK